MADATEGKRPEAILRGKEFMPGVSTEQLGKALRAEQVGKSKSILEACLLRRNMMGIRASETDTGVLFDRAWLACAHEGRRPEKAV